MTKSRSLYLVLAAFTLVVQVAAAAHSPAFHEEPVSKCHDQGKHYCPEIVEHETGPCVLCHVSLNGVYVERIQAVETDLRAETVAAAVVAPLPDSSPFTSHSPRGPPVG
jgi:hypothetical protein